MDYHVQNIRLHKCSLSAAAGPSQLGLPACIAGRTQPPIPRGISAMRTSVKVACGGAASRQDTVPRHGAEGRRSGRVLTAKGRPLLADSATGPCAGLGCAACVAAPPHDARHRGVGIQLTEGDRLGSECCPLLSDLRGWVQVRRRCARPSVPGEWAGGRQWSLCLELL